MFESIRFTGPRLATAFLLLIVLAGAASAEDPAVTELELWDGRFAVRVTYAHQGSTAPAYVSSVGRKSAVLHFFHPTNPEMLVKILDGREINGHFWVFYGAITTLPVDLEITDRTTGATRIYRKASGQPQGDADVVAFADPVPAEAPTETPDETPVGRSAWGGTDAQILSTPAKSFTFGTCVADASTLCFHEGRFRVTGRWDSNTTGVTSGARVERGSDRSGYLWFFDADTPEVLVKVLDARTINRSFWVLFGSATHLPFRLVVADLETGVEKEFSADAFGGGADPFTFGPNGDLPTPPEIVAPAAGAVVSPHDPPLAAAATLDANECLDFRLMEAAPGGEREAWRADCVTTDRPHLDLGSFAGDHVATGKLAGRAEHRLLVRRRSVSAAGDLAGPWAQRSFRTGALEGTIYSMLGGGASSLPTPRWTAFAEPVQLPDADCVLHVDSGSVPMLEFRSAVAGGEAECQVETPRTDTAPVRIVVGDCTRRLQLPPSEVRWTTPDGRTRSASLPALDLLPGQERRYDVATGGSTFVAQGATPPAILPPDLLARHSASPWWLAPGLEIERLDIERVDGPGLALPVNLTPGPGLALSAAEASPDDPMFYVTELYGAIRVLRRDGSLGTYADGLLNFDPTGSFPGSGEKGLVGTVIDPATGDLLASRVYRTDSPNPIFEFSGQVIRLPSEDGGRTAARVETVLDFGSETKQSHSHQISHLSFGPDGMLYVHVGDGFAYQQSQILDNFAGKILRLHPDGTAPPDNPFYDADDGISAADYVFALGLRNPFGGAWGPDDRLYMVENGPSVDRFARVAPGFNFAWGLGDEGTNEQMRVGALFNWPRAVTPFDLLFVPGGNGTTASPSEALPESWRGLALVSEFGPTYRFGATPRGKRLALFDFDAEPIAPETVLRYDGLGPATVAATALVTGTVEHDGLYFVDFFPEPFDDPNSGVATPGARLWRLKATPGDDGLTN